MFTNIRLVVLGGSFVFSVGVWLSVFQIIASDQTRVIRMEQIFGLTAIGLLYIFFILESLQHLLKGVSVIKSFVKGKVAFLVSAFYFGLLHGTLAFFGQLGGFEGLGFLNERYLVAVLLSFTALVLLGLSTIYTIFIKRFEFFQSRFLLSVSYPAGLFILIHALMLGTHFQDLSGMIPQLFFVALVFLLGLESLRIDRYLQKKFTFMPRFGVVFVIVCCGFSAIVFVSFVPRDTPLSIGIHAQHIETAKLAQQTNSGQLNNSLQSVVTLRGDKTKRFTVDIETPEVVSPMEDIEIGFRVFDASSGKQTVFFDRVYEKLMHLIIVDSELKYFDHIHPEQKGEGFVVTTRFPKDGMYHLYLDFQPKGAIEQQFAFSVKVGDYNNVVGSAATVDSNLRKVFGRYEVVLDNSRVFKADLLSVGQQELVFTVFENQTKQPVKTLKPYLASYGHLVMINQETYDYLHVHPSNFVAPERNENGGPEIRFLPLGFYGAIKPGIYRVFAQFNPDNELFTADFTVEFK